MTGLDYLHGWTQGVEFTRTARFPQFEDRKPPLPDGPVSRAWLDGFAEGILSARDDEAGSAQVREFCKRFREAADAQPATG